MEKRTYNILFHLHTVSGIVISVALYVIFFAGSFSFFRDEIANWERGHKITVQDQIPHDVDGVLKNLGEDYNLDGRDIEISHYFNERKINVNISGSKHPDAGDADKQGTFFYYDTQDGSKGSYQENYSLGEFLYRLHFLDQIPYPYGRYLSGFVAFFFLFAIFTGIVVHWNKMVSNFYVFRPWQKLKTLWTDAHTALGVIGFPFQFVYALTGAFFLLKALLVAPTVLTLYDGNQTQLFEDLEYSHPIFDYSGKPLEVPIDINGYLLRTKQKWPGFNVTEAHIFNYNDANMHVSISGHLEYSSKFNGMGNAIYKVSDNSLVAQKNPLETSSYLDGVKNTLFRLHLGDYGGLGLRLISFLLGIISCFVIISGIMIWLVSRDKKHVPEKRRRFNANVVRVYLSICLTMFPITALQFILVKIFQPTDGKLFISSTYFIGWLLLSIIFIMKNDNTFTNKWTLISGGILGLLIPIVNGMMTGNWFWVAHKNGYQHILLVDLLWLVLGVVSLWIAFFKLKRKPNKTLAATKT